MSLALEDFDERFFGHLQARFGSAVAALGDAPPSSSEEEQESGEGGPSRAPTRNPFENREPNLEQLALAAKENPDDFRIQMTYGYALFREERFAEAEAPLSRGRRPCSRSTSALETPTLCWPKSTGRRNARRRRSRRS